MKRTPLTVLELKGTPTDIAFQLGQRRKKIIEKRITTWNKTIQSLFKGRRSHLLNLEQGFLKAATAQAPHFLEEIRAMAEGSSLPFKDLFRLNLTELKVYAEKCTTLIFPVTNPSSKAILMAHNEDWDPKRNDVFILKAHLPHLSYAIVAYDGYLPGLSCGFNTQGLCHAINYVPAPDFRMGLPRIFITRHLVTASSFKDCLNWIKKSQRAFGQSIHLAQDDRYLGLELTAQKVYQRRPQLPTSHSNHYLTKTVRKKAEPPSLSSLNRWKVSRNLLQDLKQKYYTEKQAHQQAISILSDRSAHPYALWREADTPQDTSATLAMTVLQTHRPQMTVYRQRPLEDASPLIITLT